MSLFIARNTFPSFEQWQYEKGLKGNLHVTKVVEVVKSESGFCIVDSVTGLDVQDGFSSILQAARFVRSRHWVIESIASFDNKCNP